ncbi:PREDICTED: uncharacterized protein LOC105568414, partial [Vollenhovia emeryi]|uniref:uncharacterized protein LOC105568414 n=1 Tax=Vollenhovia emeryi TaxID=411798 RepID=UPI0005F479EF
MFWNIAGLSNKDEEFWRGLKEWEVIILMETWVEKKDWKKVKNRLPPGFVWGAQWAIRTNKKGRAAGGMLMGVRKEIKVTGTEIETGKEGFIVGAVQKNGLIWKIVGVYVGEGIEKTLEGLEEWTGKGEEGGITIIGGDFNARTGREGSRVEGGEEREKEESIRNSKDSVINKEGKRLVEFLEDKGMSILNGDTKGDEEGEYTFTGGRGNTVIDYVIGGEDLRGKVESLRIGDKIDSDHHPLEIQVKGEQLNRKEGGWSKRNRGVWNEE